LGEIIILEDHPYVFDTLWTAWFDLIAEAHYYKDCSNVVGKLLSVVKYDAADLSLITRMVSTSLF